MNRTQEVVDRILAGEVLAAARLMRELDDGRPEAREILKEIDHHYLNDLAFFREHNPSSENITRYLFERLAQRLNTENRWLCRVSAWESADACATFICE